MRAGQRAVTEALAGLYDLPVQAIGYAGMKDRHGRCTQTFSLPGFTPEDSQRIEPASPFHGADRGLATHQQAEGWTFAGQPLPDYRSSDSAAAPEEALGVGADHRGGYCPMGFAPNFFGPQRFGFDGTNVEKGRKALLGEGPRG